MASSTLWAGISTGWTTCRKTFPQSLRALYPIIYNYSYLLAEGVITVIIIRLPAVSNALERIRKSAVR